MPLERDKSLHSFDPNAEVGVLGNAALAIKVDALDPVGDVHVLEVQYPHVGEEVEHVHPVVHVVRDPVVFLRVVEGQQLVHRQVADERDLLETVDLVAPDVQVAEPLEPNKILQRGNAVFREI